MESSMDNESLEERILKMKKQRNAVILVHNYQRGEVQDIGDFVGDSLELSQKAAATDADVIVFCGVHFMAETAKILNPERAVVIPDTAAGCSLADGCPPDEFREFIDAHPGAAVLTYINASADVKAMSDASGDHEGWASDAGLLVRLIWFEPSAFTT